jgi:ABC-type nickel/cobalt efflux system permease component RcnA
MKRWLAVLIVALILGTLGITLHQNYLEVFGFVLIIFSVAAFLWSWVRLSYQIRPRPRRLFRRARRPVQEIDGVRRSRTEALHAIIFGHPDDGK